jgi:hypothetical protein
MSGVKMNNTRRHWYISFIAGVYAVICSAASVYYASQHLRAHEAAIPIGIQLLCFGLALSAVLYFWRARLGHVLFLLFTALTIISIGTAHPSATVFHCVILAILLIPFIFSKSNMIGEPDGTANGSQPFRPK